MEQFLELYGFFSIVLHTAGLVSRSVAGGSAANIIPDRCDVHLGIRVLPGMTVDDVAARVRAAVARAIREPFTLEPVSESPAMLLDPGPAD